MNNITAIAAGAIFLAIYTVLAIGKVPIYRIDRAGASLLGASLMVAAGVLTPEEAYAAFNFDTPILLLGMMIAVANLRVSGFFRLVNYWVVRACSTSNRPAGCGSVGVRWALCGAGQ